MENNNSKTDLGTLIGLLMGVAIIILGIITGGGELYWFFNLNSLLIVIGGTFAATMVNLPLKAVINTFNILKNVFKGEDYDYGGVIEEVVQKATKARKDGLLSLEADLGGMRDGFFKNGIELAINERDAKRLRTFLNLEMNNIHSRHHAGQELSIVANTSSSFSRRISPPSILIRLPAYLANIIQSFTLHHGPSEYLSLSL